MSENSHHLDLPYIMPSQAQKHVTHNEALRMLDAIVHLSVESAENTEPPPSANDGERHIVSSPATGEWSGRENEIAAFVDGAWTYFAPQAGWLAWHRGTNELLVFGEGEWANAGAQMDQMPILGINGAATPAERLVVQSSSILFNHDGNDHRLKLNKATATDTASLLFQSGFQGRAEFGLTGDEDFSIKVSDNGSQWQEAVRIEASSGVVEFPATGVVPEGSMFPNLLPDSGRFTAPSNQHYLVDSTPVLPGYVSPYNGSAFSTPYQFLHDNDTYGGSRGLLDPIVNDLIVKIFGATGLRYGAEFHVLQVDAGTGTQSAISIDGVTYYRQTIMDGNPRPARYTSGMFVRAESGELALRSPLGAVRKVIRDGVSVSFSTDDVVVRPSDGWVYFEMQLTRAAISYDLSDLSINMIPGSVGHMALPRIVAGWTAIGEDLAVLPNSRVFRD